MIESEHQSLSQESRTEIYGYKPIINKFRRVTWFSILMSILRISAVCVVYSFASQTICIQRKSIKPKLSPNQPESQYNVLQPWNIMVYLITAMVDAITLIGDSNTLKELRSQQKILQQNALKLQNRQISNRRTRAGPTSIYFSIFQILLTYKYRNRNFASAYSIARIMHLLSSFFVFGSLAVANQNSACEFHKKVLLWLYLITIYLGIYQLDITVLERSTGKFKKIQSFTSKFNIENIKAVFIDKWRKNNIKISIVVLMTLSCCLLQLILDWQLLLGIFIIENIIIHSFSIFWNKKLIQKCKDIDIKKLKLENSNFQYNLFSMLNYLTQSYGWTFQLFSILKRISIILLFFSSLRSEGQILIKIFIYASITIMIYGQYFNLNMGVNQKIDIFIHNSANQIMHIRSQCSICLLEYQQNDDIIIMPCSQQHIFHSKCLQKWLQKKKQCPLCRVKLSQLID